MRNFWILGLALAMALHLFTPNATAAVTAQSIQCNQPFVKIVQICGTTVGKGGLNGNDYSNCLPFADEDLWNIPANTMINRVYVLIDTLITGTTNFDVGDDDDADGFIDGSLSVTLGTVGLYGWNAKTAGAYLRVETAGVTDPADVYVVPTSKYYAAAGKEVKLDITTANTAGKARVFIEGYKYCDAY